MKRCLLLCTMLLLTFRLFAEEASMQFMGILIGTDPITVVEKKLADHGFTQKIYDPTNDVYSYSGTYQGKESCVYLSVMDQTAFRLVFRVSDDTWEGLQSLAATWVKQVKADHPQFKAKDNRLEATDFRYHLEMTSGLDRIVFFNLQRDNGVYDMTLTFE